MSHYFDKNERYQIIYPYESSKQYPEPDLDHGAYRCYQELVENNVMTYTFIVHNIDAGTIYYFNIPKNKHLENPQINPPHPEPHPKPHLETHPPSAERLPSLYEGFASQIGRAHVRTPVT